MTKFDELTANMQMIFELKEKIENEIVQIESVNADSQYDDGTIYGLSLAKKILTERFEALYEERCNTSLVI